MVIYFLILGKLSSGSMLVYMEVALEVKDFADGGSCGSEFSILMTPKEFLTYFGM